MADRQSTSLDPEMAQGRGVSEDGQWLETVFAGTPQGGSGLLAPLLANVYLHYVFEPMGGCLAQESGPTGDVIIVRYADDLVMGFQHRGPKQCGSFGRVQVNGCDRLTFTRKRPGWIESGSATPTRARAARGDRKPETFDFLGFTHMCGKNGNGSYAVRRMTVRKRMRRSRRRSSSNYGCAWHDPVPQTGAWLSDQSYKGTSITMLCLETSTVWAIPGARAPLLGTSAQAT